MAKGTQQEEQYERCDTARLPGAPVATGGGEMRSEIRAEMEAANARIQEFERENAFRVAELRSKLRDATVATGRREMRAETRADCTLRTLKFRSSKRENAARVAELERWSRSWRRDW